MYFIGYSKVVHDDISLTYVIISKAIAYVKSYDNENK